MKIKKTISSVCFLTLLLSLAANTTLAQRRTTGKGARPNQAAKSRSAKSDEALKAELEALLNLPVTERIEGLRAFSEANPASSLGTRAAEQLVSAHAALGDEKLQAGDGAGGIELFTQAVALAPAEMSDKLYYEIVSQLPANLFLRGQGAAALELARAVEAKAGADAKRLLVVAAFYVSAEQADEAMRVAQAASTLALDLAAAHQALGASHRLALRLDEAAAAYARSVELDSRSVPARHSLADLRRATGQAEAALMIYRELAAADERDRAARTGIVLALFDMGKRDEAERELAAALADEPRNLPLLVGAAYWYAAHGETPRALDLAGQAVQLEPRYTWAHIALARALVANKLPLEAERSLRFARQYGRFPTLDYELANALAAAGLYHEAFEELARSFTFKDGQLETQLAGRKPARADSFIQLLAPERRASIFQANAADTEANARVLKGLLALHLALDAAAAAVPASEGNASAAAAAAAAVVNDASIAAAASDFASGGDAMRAYRQLYAAQRLLRSNVALQSALELLEGARGGVEAAIDAPEATVATTADELRDVRANAIARGGTPDVPTIPRNTISNILRGRIEELTGAALLGQGKTTEAIAALRRAVSVLPEKSLYWRTAHWRLGTALATGGQEREALAAYLKSYNRESPDLARRAVIEPLYLKVNGSLSGLDAEIGPAPPRLATVAEAGTSLPAPTAQSESPALTIVAAPEPSPDNAPAAPPAIVVATPEPSPVATTEVPVINFTSVPLMAPTPAASPEPSPSAASSPVETTPEPIQANANTETPTTTARVAAKRERARRNNCALVLSANSTELSHNGGSASVIASLEGSSNLAGINATTANWSDIIILREPQGNADTDSLKFSITSISKTKGTFNVTFKSLCGSQDVTVIVK
ncbi:MAG: hypothetical protein ACR2G4_02780 [Pyrinomonadaceae bacterium]